MIGSLVKLDERRFAMNVMANGVHHVCHSIVHLIIKTQKRLGIPVLF